MGKIVFITGGARSGKSALACRLAARHKTVAFIATAQALDAEMKKRIKLHQQTRPTTWATFEEPLHLIPLIKNIDKKFDVILIDCLTLWISNLLMRGSTEMEILSSLKCILDLLKMKKRNAIIVSNEVGLGLVPPTPLGRTFRDIAGRANQLAAAEANEVFFTVSGISTKIKGRK
jgi:adenosylcobinamide kinase / adenosylcobinamide-phosphate guanylyltransferase